MMKVMVVMMMLMMTILNPECQRVEATQWGTWEGVNTNITILKEVCLVLIEAQAWEGSQIYERKKEDFK